MDAPSLIEEANRRLCALGYKDVEASVAAAEGGVFRVKLSGSLVRETTLEVASLLSLIRSLPLRDELVEWHDPGSPGR